MNIKKLSTVSLFIFGVVLISILTAGLVFYQNKKDSKISVVDKDIEAITKNNIDNTDSSTNQPVNIKNNMADIISVTSNTTTNTTDINNSSNTKVLNMTEVAKHNTSSDCWIVISGNIYDITSYFGSHPGGNSTMSATCGRDATDAYMTQDPYATSGRSRSAHSSRAKNLLDDYLLGTLQ